MGGPESEQAFFALLAGATRYIHICTYIIGGKAGLRLVRTLARKQAQGVEIRLLFCASGLVLSGSPSGTGFVSRLSELRSFLAFDLYVRKKILAEIQEHAIPSINSAPIGRHWRRRDFRQAGITDARSYYAWARARGIPEPWLVEQEDIDRQCTFGFANVDHRKFVIVDGERAFVGSQNIADSYFYANELDPDPRVNVRNWQWHDNSTIVEGGVVRRMNQLFACRWSLSGGDLFDPHDSFYAPPLVPMGTAAVALQTTIPGMMRAPLKKTSVALLEPCWARI